MTEWLSTGPWEDPRRYRIHAPDGIPITVGGGGEGLVYEAFTDGTRVALKMLTTAATDDYPQLVARTAALTSVDHAHLMRHIEVFLGPALGDGTEPGLEEFDLIYSVADWVDGAPLTDVAAERSAPERFTWVTEIATAVDHLHHHRSELAPDGIVHRDIKPSNVRIEPTGGAVLIDFGIARPLDIGDLTQGAGTFNWRAPEVLAGSPNAGAAADRWGVGALAYWMLLEDAPRIEGRAAIRERLLDAARNSGLGDPIGVANHISRMLSTDPADRPKDLAAWGRHLTAIVARPRRPYRQRRAVRVTAALATAVPLVAALGGIGLRSLEPEEPSATQVLGTTVRSLRVDEHMDLYCDAIPTPTFGIGAEPGETVTVTVVQTKVPPRRPSPFPPATISETPTVVTRDAASEVEAPDEAPHAPRSSEGTRLTVQAKDNGSFVAEWSCTPYDVGAEWEMRFATSGGLDASTTIRAIEPIEELTASVPPAGPDGRIHVPVGTVANISASATPKRTVLVAELGLNEIIVESSDPEVLTITTIEPGNLYEVKALKPGEVTVTSRLRSITVTHLVTVDPA